MQELRSAKASYLKRLKEVEERKKEREAERKRLEQWEKRAKRRRKIGRLCEFLGIRMFFALLGACSLCLFALIVAQLNAGPTANWEVVFIPLWVLFIFVFVAVVADTVLYQKRADPDSVLHALWESHLGVSSGWVSELAGQHEGRRKLFTILSGYGLFLLIIIFVILLAVKLAGSPIYWTEAFIPAWLALILASGAVAPPFKDQIRTETAEFAATFLLVVAPFLVFLVVLPVFLDGFVHTSLEIVMVPLWVQDACFIVGVAGHSVSTAIAAGEWRELRSNLFYMFGIWIIAAPIITFQGLLCAYVKDNSAMMPGGLFAPLFIWFGVLTLVAFFGVCMSDGDNIEDDFPPATPVFQQASRYSSSSPLRQTPGGAASRPHSTHVSRRRTGEVELVRGYGTRQLQQDIIRNSWAHSHNPQFDMDAYSDMWDQLIHSFTGDVTNEDELSDFQRMQLAISRALADINSTNGGPTARDVDVITNLAHAPNLPPYPRPPTPPPPGFHNPRRLDGVEEEDESADIEAQREAETGEGPRTPTLPPPIEEGEFIEYDSGFLPLPPHPPPLPPSEPPPPLHPPPDDDDNDQLGLV